MIIAANKADHPGAEENIEKLKSEFKDYIVIPTSAEIELALKKAQNAGIINYTGNDFEILNESALNDAQKNALEYMRNYLKKYGGTGIQDLINKAYFELLDMIVVYPVEDENKYCDKKGNVLPDAHLVKRGATAKDLAFKIHTENEISKLIKELNKILNKGESIQTTIDNLAKPEIVAIIKYRMNENIS